MGGPAWLSSAVAAADAATLGLGLQEEVVIARALERDALGKVTAWAAPVRQSGMVQRKTGQLEGQGGRELKFRAIIGFTRPVDVAPGDVVTLWDGLTGPILAPQGGLDDPSTGAPFARVVHLG